MKYLLLILAFVLCGCSFSTMNRNQLNSIILAEQNEIDRLNELNKKLQQPENIPRDMIRRNYKVDDTLIVRINEPEDCLLAAEIEQLLSFITIKINTVDNDYWLPSRKFVDEKLLPAYREYIIKNKIKYGNKFDCDDFSRLFCMVSQSIYTDLVVNKSMQAICISEIYYKSESMFSLVIDLESALKIPFTRTFGHAINMIILDDLSVIFIEPQTGYQIRLSESELKSIMYCKF